MKIDVDRARCTGLGICEALAPAFFEVGSDGELIQLSSSVDGKDIDQVRAAVDGCPTEALRLVDE